MWGVVNLFLYVCVFRHLLLQPLRVNGVKVYTENVDKRQVIMDLQIRYAANSNSVLALSSRNIANRPLKAPVDKNNSNNSFFP